VIKDAGDDPDVTDKMPIRARVSKLFETPDNPKAYSFAYKNSTLILTAKSGIGIVTRPGLDAEQGHWAINKVPRQMILDNLIHYGFGREKCDILVELTAVNGEKIAERTLNSMVGVEGGLSILGTSGIVVPYSHEAYIKTIEVLLKGLAADGADEVVFSTGGRTRTAAMKDLPHLSEVHFIRIGDFIADSLKSAVKQGFTKIHIACMPGKLYKYAHGFVNTHAGKKALTMDMLVQELKKLQVSDDIIAKAGQCGTIAEVKANIAQETFTRLMSIFMNMAEKHLAEWASGASVFLHVYDTVGNKIERI
jgi:cobalt-precorrin-5B (C1)-methyltransferase